MTLHKGLERARRLARKVLWQYGMNEPGKIDPFVLLARLAIEVTYGQLDGPAAQLTRHGKRAIIRISDQIVQLGRLRFSIAHEIGHYLLGHRNPSELPQEECEQQEREADVFATELLMPETMVHPFCARTPIDLVTVRAIVETFRSSIVSAAVRYVELSPASCAVVYSEHGLVEWAKRSRAFADRIPEQFEIGAGAVAFDYHARGVLDTSARVVPADVWLGRGAVTPVASLVEHAVIVPEPGWGGVLSLLGANAAPT